MKFKSQMSKPKTKIWNLGFVIYLKFELWHLKLMLRVRWLTVRTLSVFTLDMAWFLEMNSSMSSVSKERPSSKPTSTTSIMHGKDH